MASSSPFDFSNSKFVAPIPCPECGHNMHCCRRTPEGAAEHQCFYCGVCHNEIERVAGVEPSDARIEQEAERITGLQRR